MENIFLEFVEVFDSHLKLLDRVVMGAAFYLAVFSGATLPIDDV